MAPNFRFKKIPQAELEIIFWLEILFLRFWDRVKTEHILCETCGKRIFGKQENKITKRQLFEFPWAKIFDTGENKEAHFYVSNSEANMWNIDARMWIKKEDNEALPIWVLFYDLLKYCVTQFLSCDTQFFVRNSNLMVWVIKGAQKSAKIGVMVSSQKSCFQFFQFDFRF